MEVRGQFQSVGGYRHHGVVTHNTTIWSFIAFKTPNLTHNSTNLIHIIWFRQHNLCTEIPYVTRLQHVSAFWPSSSIIHTPLTYLIPSLQWPMFTYGCILSVIYILAQCPCTRLSCSVKILKYYPLKTEILVILKIQFVPQRKHIMSPLRSETG
jgi:hypothetical protein